MIRLSRKMQHQNLPNVGVVETPASTRVFDLVEIVVGVITVVLVEIRIIVAAASRFIVAGSTRTVGPTISRVGNNAAGSYMVNSEPDWPAESGM